RPVVAQPACPLGELRVIADDFENVLQVVQYRAEVARAQLRMRRAGVEECGRAADETERREDFVELDRAVVLLLAFVDGESHRHTHPEILRRLQTAALMVVCSLRITTWGR